MRCGFLAASLAIGAVASNAFALANHCGDGWPEPTYKIAEGDIVWCDDMDAYCAASQGTLVPENTDTAGWWTGYPPLPTMCTTSDSKDNNGLLAHWTDPHNCGNNMSVDTGSNVNSPFILNFPSSNLVRMEQRYHALADAIDDLSLVRHPRYGTTPALIT